MTNEQNLKPASVDVLAVLDAHVSMREATGKPNLAAELREARDAVAKLIAAAEPLLRGDMTTVRGRLEMARRLRALAAALARVQS